MSDISALIKSAGIDVQRTATDIFGMAVEDFIGTPASKALNSVFDPTAPATNRNDGSWYATSHAANIANSKFRPKLKFLFRVEFLFEDAVLQKFGIANWQRNFSFLVTSIDKPKINFDYEDVNQYNFRTKILKKITYEDLNLSFLDDVGNDVYEFFRFLLMAHSPISRKSIGLGQGITDAYTAYSTGSGMTFSQDITATNDFAHRGAVDTELGNVIKAIKVTQMFMDPNENIDDAAKQVSFFFINPKIISMDLDNVEHESNDPSKCSMRFHFDFMLMSEMENLEVLGSEKKLPPVGSAPADATGTGRNSGSPKSGGNNPYSSIIGGVLGRAAQKITSDTVGRALRKVPGLGPFADVLGNVARGVTAKTILGVGSTISQSFARPSRDVVIDDSVIGRDTGSYVPSTKNDFSLSNPTNFDITNGD